MTISSEAIEAVAGHFYTMRSGIAWSQIDPKSSVALNYRRWAAEGLEAAQPFMRPQSSRKAEDVGRNIVNQLADLWGVPVDIRQATNDRCWAFAAELVASASANRDAVIAGFIAQREEYVRVLRQCVDADSDYHRWQGHAEARRQLSEKLSKGAE